MTSAARPLILACTEAYHTFNGFSLTCACGTVTRAVLVCDHCRLMAPIDGETRLGEICGSCNVGAYRLTDTTKPAQSCNDVQRALENRCEEGLNPHKERV